MSAQQRPAALHLLGTQPNEEDAMRRSVIAASFGNALEWYDFSVYAFFAGYIAANFFQAGDQTQAILATFVVFGAGFIARPLGSVVVGIVSDRKGRKPALLLSLFTMALGVFLIGSAPTTATIGIAAPLLLLVGRLLQGFSAGGELGSAAAYLVENAPKNRRGTYAAWLQASMGISNVLSAVAGLAITSLFTNEEVTAWAWRLPFIFGLLVVPVGLYIRRHLPETGEFRDQARHRSTWETVVMLFRDNWRSLVAGFGFCILWNTAVYTFIIFGPTYYRITPALGFDEHQAFLASTIGNVFFVAACAAAGRLADRVGRRRMLVTGCGLLIVVPLALLLLLHSVPTVLTLLVVHSVLCVNIAVFVGVAPATLPMAFPTATRSTGVSVTYNLAAIGFAGFIPALLTWAGATLTSYSPAILVALCAAVSLASVPPLFQEIGKQESTDEEARVHA